MDPNATVIPEMQRVKEKYPQYKDVNDYDLLQTIAKKYPVYQKPLEDVDQRMNRNKETDVQKEQFKNNIIAGSNELLPDALVGLGNVPLGRVLRHSWGAVQAAVSGQSPIDGFKNPDQQQPFGVSYAKAENLDLNKPLDFTLATIADVSANLLTGHLLYGAPVKAATQAYTSIKGTAFDNLRGTIVDEFKKAGASHANAMDLADHIVSKIKTQGFLKTNPLAVNMLARNVKDKLGNAILDHINTAKSSAQEQGYSSDFFKRSLAPRLFHDKTIDVDANVPIPNSKSGSIGTRLGYDKLITPAPPKTTLIGVSSKVEPTKVLPSGKGVINQPPEGAMRTSDPSTDFGRQIQAQIQEKYDIPFHSASDGRQAIVKLFRNQQIPSTIQPPTDGGGSEGSSGLGVTPVSGPPKPQTPTIQPNLRPAIKLDKYQHEVARPGEDHDAMVKRSPKLKNKERGFVDKYNNFLTRTEVAKKEFLSNPLYKIQIPPVKPEEVSQTPDIADEVLQRQGNQRPDTIALTKQIKTIPTPEIPKITEPPTARQTLKTMRLQSIKDAAEKYHPNTFWDVTFTDDYGVHNTMVDGPGLKLLEQKAKVVNKSKLTSEKGELNLEPFFNIITNIKGELEKASNEYAYVAKTFGNSFFIGEKYPPFKKVLDAIQNPIDISNEQFYNGVEMLDRKHGEGLAPHLQERVNQALNYGDSQSVQKYFNDQELKDKFDLSNAEIKAYQGFVKMYQHGLKIAVETRKLETGFDKLDSQKQQYAEADIKNQLDKIGGYISHTRLGGDWAVYQPGDNEDNPPKFFDLFRNKSDANKISKTLDGSRVYLKTNIPRDDYGKLSIHDLQSLAEAQDLNPQSPDYLALKEELMKRTSNKNWIRRNWVPRADQTLKDKYDNAIDYLNGQTARYARVKGRIDAQKAFNDNAKMMSPSLAKYARDLMDIYYSGKSQDSNKIFQSLNKTVYAYRLMFKTSFFLQHLTHPLSVTYPELAKGINGLDTEKIFFNAYNMSRRYALNKITGSPHGLSKDTMDMMDTLHKQGYLGDQLNKFQLDSRTRLRSGFEHFIGSMARVSEGTNRIHSAMAGMLKANHLGITDPKMREDFVKNFMKKTVFLYGRLYTPTLVTGSGNMKSLMNTMYRFRSFEVNYLHALSSNFRYGPAAYLRSIGGMTAMAGIKGAPFFALLAMAYAWKTGHTLDNDMRESAREAHIPDKAIDMSLHGVPSLDGADLSGLIGTSDIISPYGDPMAKIGGASVGFAEQIMQGVHYLNVGDRERALEKLTPDFISRILRARRYSIEGIKKENGDTILANPSRFDTILSGTGIQPLNFTKAYDLRDAKDTIQKSDQKRNAQYNQLLAKAHSDPARYDSIMNKIDQYNKTAKDEDKIRISRAAIHRYIKLERKGKQYPKRMRDVIDHINQRYGVNE